ncbi:MAG TPA: tetraacyldisaccharide 4'-kinase [Chryseosolibacter sp.]|nr:tetraacyldisaccharide 4'-kinase [Chryseosolibacter sp.]
MRILLFPFAVAYDAVTSIRNRLYDTGAKPAASFEIPVIAVGNLAVGGTGKTPMIEYLVRLLDGRANIATLSRGYGRKTKGIRIAGKDDDASTIGDEPLQFYRKFKDKIVVAVGEERAYAVPHILQLHPRTSVILLDDAFQHRRVRPSFQILLTDYNHLFTKDYLLPAGRLREARRGASRANVIVVTKCPENITDDKMIEIASDIRKYSDKAVFFTRIGYGDLKPAGKASPYKPQNVVLVSGIADAAPLRMYVRNNYNLIRHFDFADHHAYSQSDVQRICEAALPANAVVVTTEKDIAKLDTETFTAQGVPLFFLPIEIQFLKNGKEFDEMILNTMRQHAG